MQTVGVQAVLAIISHLCFVLLSFYCLQALRFEQLFKPNHVRQVQVILMLVAIVIGYNVSQFFLEIIAQAKNIVFLV